jgi:hypothetical protein
MEDPNVTLSDDDVRERFSAFHDGELSPDEARAMRQRLAESAQLAAEFEAFKRVMGGLAALAAHGSQDGEPAVARGSAIAPAPASASTEQRPSDGDDRAVVAAKRADDRSEPLVLPEDEAVDLLPDLQKTLHKRSGGKFYKTRASRVVGTRPIEAIAATTLVLLVLVYVLMTFVSGLRPAEQRPAHESSPIESSSTLQR